MYQSLYDKVKTIVKRDACMKFYDMARTLYLDTNALGIGLGTGLVQVRDCMSCGHNEVPGNVILHLIAMLSNAYQVWSSATAT